MYPAGCAGLYGLNPSTGAVALDGVQPLSRAFDCIGTMAKTAADLTILVENVLTPAARSRLPKAGYGEVSVSDWQDVSIAFTETTWGCKFTGSRAQGSVVGEKWADPAIVWQAESSLAGCSDESRVTDSPMGRRSGPDPCPWSPSRLSSQPTRLEYPGIQGRQQRYQSHCM